MVHYVNISLRNLTLCETFPPRISRNAFLCCGYSTKKERWNPVTDLLFRRFLSAEPHFPPWPFCGMATSYFGPNPPSCELPLPLHISPPHSAATFPSRVSEHNLGCWVHLRSHFSASGAQHLGHSSGIMVCILNLKKRSPKATSFCSWLLLKNYL